MPNLASHDLCTGCAACFDVCAHAAITMEADLNGWPHPCVNETECVNCGRCEYVCPTKHTYERDSTPVCIAARAKDRSQRIRSSSGGIFPLLARYVIELNGVVYGAEFESLTQKVRHTRATTFEGVDNFRGSKYVQSDVVGVYRLVREDLLKKKVVLFSGTPCQIAAVRVVCKDCLDGLICAEILCHGVPSPKLFSLLLAEMKGVGNESMKFDDFEFRDKSYGWRRKNIKAKIGEVVFCGGKAAAGYMGAFMARMSIRECCENCAFNDGRSGADVTLGDFWGVERVAPELDDGTGSSLVILHTEKGRKIFGAIEVDKKVVDIYGAIRDNPSYRSKRNKNKRRDIFLKQIRDGFCIESGFATATHHGIKEVLLGRFKKGLQRLLNKI